MDTLQQIPTPDPSQVVDIPQPQTAETQPTEPEGKKIPLYPLFLQCEQFQQYVETLEEIKDLTAAIAPTQRKISVAQDKAEELLSTMNVTVKAKLDEMVKEIQ